MNELTPKAASQDDASSVEGAEQTTDTQPDEQSGSVELARIDVETQEYEVDGDSAATDEAAATLVETLKIALKTVSLTFSTAALRDMAPMGETPFGPKDVVYIFNELGFDASFGELKASAIKESHLPMIAFQEDGNPFLVTQKNPDGTLTVQSIEDNFTSRDISADEFAEVYAGFTLLYRQSAQSKQNGQGGHWFWSAFSKSKWIYGQVILAAAFSNFLGLSTSLFIMVVYDRVVPNEAIESLFALTLGVMIALTFDFVIKSLRANFIDRAGKRADVTMARMIFDKILHLRLDAKGRKSGAVASVVREFDTLRDFFTSATLIAIVDLPFIFFFIFVIYLIGGNLAIVPLLAVPIVIILGLAVQPALAKLASGAMETGMSKQSVLVETLSGLNTIRATGAGRFMRQRFEEASANQSELGLKSRMFSQFAINSAASVQQFAQIALIFYGVFLIREGSTTMGGLIASVILAGRTLAPLSQLAAALARANSARQAYRSLGSLMTETSPEDEIQQRLSRPVLRGEIEFRNVSYSFPGANEPIIRNLSVKIPAGQKVALVGKMGSGKSTFSGLAAGLLTPSEGAVLIDGVDIRKIDKTDLLRNVGVMLQETWLFSGTVRENLQMGYFEYDDEHILKVAKISGVDDFIGSHPSGYDLMIREHGVGLSGGQKQTINLARAILHDPNILILDEPTSSMDTASEAATIERLSAAMDGKTMLAVTHRNSMLKMVDRVLVIDRGAIMLDSPPSQLKAAQK